MQALTLAMTLHEKGRAAMKKKDYAEAILLLLEADKEFTYVYFGDIRGHKLFCCQYFVVNILSTFHCC